MPPISTPALILHAFAYGDTSRILRILTPEYGLRSVIAKGARGPRSRFAGVLEPFTEGEAQFILRENRDLLTLTGFTLSRSRQAIGRDLNCFTGASLIAEILIRFATDEAHPELYRATVDAFDRLAASPEDPSATALTALWFLASLLGFQPQLDSCVGCGRSLPTSEPARFDIDAGGVACTSCRRTGRLLSSDLRLDLARMCSSLEQPSLRGERHTHADLLSAFFSAHVFHGRPLRSLPLFLEQLR
jgi:DNA repair protein RecO (recombination protein O)